MSNMAEKTGDTTEKIRDIKCDKCRMVELMKLAKLDKDSIMLDFANEITKMYDVLISITGRLDKLERSYEHHTHNNLYGLD